MIDPDRIREYGAHLCAMTLARRCGAASCAPVYFLYDVSGLIVSGVIVAVFCMSNPPPH